MADKAELLYKPLTDAEMPQVTGSINDDEGVLADARFCSRALLCSKMMCFKCGWTVWSVFGCGNV